MRLAYVRGVAVVMGAARIAIGMLLTISILINFANIVGRYVFHQPISGAEEVMLFIMVAIVFLAFGVVGWEGRHIKMDILVDRFPPRARAVLRVAIEILAIGVAAVVIDLSLPVIQHLAMFNQRSQAANVPLAIPQAFIPIGFALLIAGTIARLIDPVQPSDDAMLEDI